MYGQIYFKLWCDDECCYLLSDNDEGSGGGGGEGGGKTDALITRTRLYCKNVLWQEINEEIKKNGDRLKSH